MPTPPQRSGPGLLTWIKRAMVLVVGVALGIATLVFITLNREAVTVDFYFGEPMAVPLWALVATSLLLGWLIPRLLGIGGWFRHARERARLRRRIAELEREVIELRNIPLDLEAGTPRASAMAPVPTRPRLVEVVTARPRELLEADASDSGEYDAATRNDS